MKYLHVVQKPSNNLLLGPNSEYLQTAGSGALESEIKTGWVTPIKNEKVWVIKKLPAFLGNEEEGHVNVHEEES